MASLVLKLSMLLFVVSRQAAAQSPSLQAALQTQLNQTVYVSCNAQAAPALAAALASMSVSGYTNLTCPQWTSVSGADSACIPTVSTSMLALVGNSAVVPAAYQSILTNQMTALFSPPCPSWNITLASVSNISAFSANLLSYSLASATGTTVVARMSNYIISASATINITALLPVLAASPASANSLVANVTSALAFSLGVSPTQLTLGAINVAPMLTVAYNVSCGGTNSTYAAALVSRASGLGTSPTLTYALSLLSLPPASVTAPPTVFVVGTLQLSSLNSTLILPAVIITTSAVQQFYPGSTMVSLVNPPLNMQAVVQSALTSTIVASCASAAQLALLSTLQLVQTSGLSSMTCAQWSLVSMADSSCLLKVRTTMLSLISAVVPSAYKTAMTAQAGALFTCACPLYNVTLAQVNISTFSVPALTVMLAAVMPSNTTASVQVQDFAVSAQVVLSSIPSAVSTGALVPAFVTALAASLGVTASTVTLGTVVPGRRRLLSQLTVPFTFSSLGTNTSVVASKVALVSGLSSPTSALSLGLAQVGVPPVTLLAPPWVSAIGTVQVLGTSGSNLTAAAEVLAVALPRQFPGSTFVPAVAPPAAPPAPLPLVINNAGSDPTTFAAMYSTMLAAQCGFISSPGVLDAASALLGAPRVTCAPLLSNASSPTTMPLALPPAPSQQSNATNELVQTAAVISAALHIKPAAAAALPFLVSVVLILLLAQ